MRTLGIIAILIALAGCGNKATSRENGASKPAGTETAQPERATLPDKGTLPIDPEKEMTAPPVPEGTYKIDPPRTDGWTESETKLVSVAKKMDDAMRSLGSTLIQTSTNYDDPEMGSMRAVPDIVIQDDSTFKIICAAPSDRGEDRVLIGDGERRVEKFKSEWNELKPLDKSGTISPQDAVKRWPLEFPILMFSRYRESADIWTPLFKGYESGVGGYKVEIEEGTFQIGGVSRSHYRVVAKRAGDEPIETEIIVDKERMLPLTIRVNTKGKDGKDLNAMWTGRWGFGGKHDPKDFVIPVTPDGK